MNTPRNLAYAVAIAAVLLNLALEHFLLGARPAEGVLIPGLLNLRYAGNQGISFSLFWQNNATGMRFLSAILLVITLFIAVWAWRARNNMLACGFGLVLGGAVGNLLDRQFYGAVLDFLAVHIGGLPLFVCNLSDIYISAGVLVLVAEELMPALRRDRL